MRKIILSTRIKPVLLIALCAALLILCVSFGVLTANTRSASGVSVLALPENVTVTEITGVDLTGTVTTASSYADIKAALAVTARGSDGGGH